MTTVNSDIAAKQADFSTSKLLPVNCGGRVRVARGVYTAASAAAAGTVINLAKLPTGARVLGNSTITFEAGQDATLTVKVGDSKDDDRYLAAVAPGASLVTKTLDADAFGSYVLEEEGFIFITTGVAALTSGKKIAFEIFYVID